MNRSSIEWTHFTANPIRYRDRDGNVVHACIHKSEGCRFCYAEVMAKRWGRAGKAFTAENMKALTPFLDENETHRMRSYKPASGKRCFIGDMTDIFGEWIPDDLLNRLFSNTLEMREDVTWQLLTKRADRARRYLSWRWGEGRIPMRNIHVGVSVEDQKTADERIPLLLQTPAAVRFLSYEPALGPVEFMRLRPPNATWYDCLQGREHCGPSVSSGHPKLDWVIVGGESGPGARPFNIQWARDVIQQCKAARVACFVKQLGANPEGPQGCGDCDPCIYGQPCMVAYNVGLDLNDRKGGDMSEWPEDLKVREFPKQNCTGQSPGISEKGTL